MRRKILSRRSILLLSAFCALLSFLLLAMAIALIASNHQWTADGLPGVLLTAAGLSLAISTAIGTWLRQNDQTLEPPGPAEEVLERWRLRLRQEAVRRRAGAGRSNGYQASDLSQMLRGGTVIAMRSEEWSREDMNALGDPRPHAHTRTLEWSEITAEWDAAAGRMVILGQAGYGKTVAALTLLKHINTTESKELPLAEIFPLADWYRWQAEHHNEPLSNWLTDRLAESYPETRGPIARALVDGPIVPLLDGLDEVPPSHRLACKEAIDAYAELSPPFRPFIVTCRPVEYLELAPDWVSFDRRITLIGLEPDQVGAILAERTEKKPGWDKIRQSVSNRDEHVLRLFRSPLRLGIALQAYRDRDASELGQLTPDAAAAHLWDQLLASDRSKFHAASSEQIRSWLTFLATRMKRHNRPRFWLHELYLFAPEPQRTLRRFRVAFGLTYGLLAGLLTALSGRLNGASSGVVVDGLSLGVVVGLILGLTVGLVTRLGVTLFGGLSAGLIGGLSTWLAAGVIGGPAGGLVGGLVMGLVSGLVMGFGAKDTPSLIALVPWRARLNQVKRNFPRSISFASALGVGVGIVSGLSGGHLAYGVADGLVFGVAGGVAGSCLMDFVNAGRVTLLTDPPLRMGGKGLSAVLTATRNVGLIAGIAAAVVIGLFGGVLTGLLTGMLVQIGPNEFYGFGLGFRAGAIEGISASASAGVFGGLTVALLSGLDAWLYHHWVRRVLARRGLLPKLLRPFLEWCALPERGWLRISDASEFRHRELLEHLAQTSRATSADVVSVQT